MSDLPQAGSGNADKASISQPHGTKQFPFKQPMEEEEGEKQACHSNS